MTSASYIRADISIHTTEDPASPHIDFDDIKNITIHEVENYGATGTVQLVNNYETQTENLLSNYCTLWSDGTPRKLDRAMFLRIYHDSRTTENAIGVFLITQINARDGLITLTFCDSTQYLRSVGADYVMNHSSGVPSWHTVGVRWENDHAVIDHDARVTVYGGSHHDIMMGKMIRTQYTTNDETLRAYTTPNKCHIGFRKQLGRTATHLHKIVINGVMPTPSPIFHTTARGQMRFFTEGGNYISNDFELDNRKTTLTFDYSGAPVPMKNDKIWLFLELDLYSPEKEIIIPTQKNVDGASVEIGKLGGNVDFYDKHALVVDIVLSYDTDDVIGSDSQGKFTVSQLGGETPTRESIELVNYPGRAKALYIDPSSLIGGNVVFQHIVAAENFTADEFQGMRDLHVFRCNGDYIHNYLLALADMPNTDGRQFAFRSSTTVWNHLNAGFRFKKTDQTFVYFYYAYFGAIEGGQAMMSFNPSISMKNHPRLAVVKGTTEDKKPIMVALLDPNVPRGASIPTVNSSVTTAVEGALATYSDVITNKSDDWQGEVEVSGIHLDYFGRGSAIGGIPISITDHRYGFLDYKAKIKEITWDFANQKTTIVVNNYSEVYSNAILDTTKMAYSAGDMSAEGTNADMFVRQFVNLDATSMTSDGATNSVTMIVRHGVDATVTDATTIDLPELNVRVVNAYFPPGTGQATSQYGVYAVKVGNRTHEIPAARCPDKQINQSLIVNVIYRLK